jgi:type IV pilus assembly protein PilM
VCSIDIGSYAIKVALLESRFRQTKVTAFRQFMLEENGPAPTVPPPPQAVAEPTGDSNLSVEDPGDVSGESATAQAETRQRPASSLLSLVQQAQLRKILRDKRFRADTYVTAIPGSVTMIRYLAFPFSDPRKIGPVVGYELDGQIPYELDEVVFDHLILHSGVKEPGAETRVLVAAAAHDVVADFLSGLEAVGFDPDVLTVAPVAYEYLVENQGADTTQLTAIIDVGHRHTNICVSKGGHPLFVRTLSRGGAQITEALCKKLGIDLTEAERYKRKHGFVPKPGDVLAGERQQIGEAVSGAFKLWDLGVRQSIAAIKTELGGFPQQIVLCGGGSALSGLDRHVAALFGLPPHCVVRPQVLTGQGLDPDSALAVGLTHMGVARRRDSIDLRQGDLEPASKISLLKEKALVIAVFFVVATALLVANGWAKLSRMEKEAGILATQLAKKTEKSLGRQMSNPVLVLRRIRKLRRRKGATSLPIPQASAYAILSEISRKAPSSKKVTLDVRKLNIRNRKVTLKGTAGSASEVEDFASALRKIECFDKVQPGTTTEVGTGDEKKSEFTINIANKCM